MAVELVCVCVSDILMHTTLCRHDRGRLHSAKIIVVKPLGRDGASSLLKLAAKSEVTRSLRYIIAPSKSIDDRKLSSRRSGRTNDLESEARKHCDARYDGRRFDSPTCTWPQPPQFTSTSKQPATACLTRLGMSRRYPS